VEGAESFAVEDAGGLTLAVVYFENERVRAKSLRRIGKEDTRRMANAMAAIPERQTKLRSLEGCL